MSSCCVRGCREPAEFMVSVPSYQQDACGAHVGQATFIIDVTTGWDCKTYTITRLTR